MDYSHTHIAYIPLYENILATLTFIGFLAATKQLDDWFIMSVRPSVTPFLWIEAKTIATMFFEYYNDKHKEANSSM